MSWCENFTVSNCLNYGFNRSKEYKVFYSPYESDIPNFSMYTQAEFDEGKPACYIGYVKSVFEKKKRARSRSILPKQYTTVQNNKLRRSNDDPLKILNMKTERINVLSRHIQKSFEKIPKNKLSADELTLFQHLLEDDKETDTAQPASANCTIPFEYEVCLPFIIFFKLVFTQRYVNSI